MNQLMSHERAVDLIRQGASLSIAGSGAALDRLPAGQWIGGTTPYFMAAEGGIKVHDDRVFVTDLSSVGEVTIAYHRPDALADISGHAPDSGFALAIVPAGSETHKRFATEAASYPDTFMKPTVGWVAGFDLADMSTASAYVYDGRTATRHAEGAVVGYVRLPEEANVSVEIFNLFEPDRGDIIHFDTLGFEVRECRVNGTPASFAQYIHSRGLEHGRLPLVGDFAGAHVNVSLQTVDAVADKVVLYAPVFPDVDYCFAKPIHDYAGAFRAQLAAKDTHGAVASCNCILNFLFGELEGEALGGLEGPVAFGEIAYQLLNQTLVTVRVR